MKTVKFTAALLVLTMLVTMPVSTVRAAESGWVWLSVASSPTGAGTEALILTDTAVADGLICVEYDSTRLSYTGLLAVEETVAQYAVNSREPGLVKISWVSGNYNVTGDGKLLFRLCFDGTGGESIALSGQVHDAAGGEIPFGAPDRSGLEDALASAAQLDAQDYTVESWTALTDAVEQGRRVLEDPMASSRELNRAAQAILDALENLQSKPRPDTSQLEQAVDQAQKLDPDSYTPESFAAVRAALDRALDVLAREEVTQEEVDAALKTLEDALERLKRLPEEVPGTEPDPGPGESPETADTSRPGFALILAIVSGAGSAAAAVCFLRSRKKEAAE